MNLLCPSCQKMLQVPDQYAGQQMRCPLCNNIFTVPGLADAPAMPPAPPPFSGAAPPPPPLPSSPMPSKPADAPFSEPAKSRTPAPPAPPPVVGDYEKMKSYFVSPRVVPWITFGAVAAMFLLSFFPYGFVTVTSGKQGPVNLKSDPTLLAVGKVTEMRDGGVVAIKGNAWGLGFGDGGSAIYIIYDLLLLFAFLVAIASILIHLKIIPTPPPLEGLRGLVLGGLLLIAFVFLFLNELIGVFELGILPLTFFGLLAFWAHLLALITVALEIWMQRRGPTRPTPRIDVHW